MTIAANSLGVVTGKFTIPADVPAGIKNVSFAGAGGSTGQASFFGQGTRVDDVRTMVTQITTTFWQANVDPIAQTFTLTQAIDADSVDLWFVAKGTTPVSVQIRETQVGFPTRVVLAEGRLKPADITVNGWTRFNLRAPVRLEPGVEYAIVALCNDAVSELATAELGKYDTTAQRWITSQPYTVGVLLSSSNASTWTAYQDRDLAFRLNRRKYTEAERLVDLGNVSLTAATDLLVLTTIDSPKSTATGDLEVTLPDGTVVRSGDNQRISLPTATTGTVNVKARLRSDDDASAAIYPGTQIVAGAVSLSAPYISRAIDADAAGANVKVLIDAIIPSGAGVLVEVSGVDAGDSWLSMTDGGLPPKLLNGDLGLYEYQFTRTAVMEARVRVRLTLTGAVAARPHIRNLRVIVT